MSAAWQDHAACAKPTVNPDWWAIGVGNDSNNQLAIAVCGRCPVRQACLDHGVSQQLEGIYGGEALRGAPKRAYTALAPTARACARVECGRRFEAVNGARKFCGSDCWAAARAERRRVIHRPVDVEPTTTLRETSGSEQINSCEESVAA